MKDPMFLAQKSVPATEEDRQIITDLVDTLLFHHETCVGMAANMIGERKNIIVVSTGVFPLVMINPKIVRKTGAFKTVEGCLSLQGTRPCTRYKDIEVEYLDRDFNTHRNRYKDWIAQIIQHEMDHCNGIII